MIYMDYDIEWNRLHDVVLIVFSLVWFGAALCAVAW